MGVPRLCTIPCGRKKIWDVNPEAGPTPARDVYVGPFAGMCRDYADRFFEDWVVLSAKYGFLRPHDLVPTNYDVTFSNRAVETITLSELREQIRRKELTRYQSIVILGGRHYADAVRKAFGEGYSYVQPLAGCRGIGQMMRRLRGALDSGKEIDEDDRR
ncbi:MAG TPA: hypothetical protein PLG65_02820 [Bacillota bacterium]|nr:hypothetical protein [Bacillota bacterium]